MKYITGVLCCLVVLVGCGTGKGAAKDNKTVEQNTTTKIDTALGYNDELPAWFTEMLGYLLEYSMFHREDDNDIKASWLNNTRTLYQYVRYKTGNYYFPDQITSSFVAVNKQDLETVRNELTTALAKRSSTAAYTTYYNTSYFVLETPMSSPGLATETHIVGVRVFHITYTTYSVAMDGKTLDESLPYVCDFLVSVHLLF